MRMNPTLIQISRLRQQKVDWYALQTLAKLKYAIEWWNMMPVIYAGHGTTPISQVGPHELCLAQEWLRICPSGSQGALTSAYHSIIDWMAQYPANEPAEIELWKRTSYGTSMKNLSFAQVLHRIRDACLLNYMCGNPPPIASEEVNLLARLEVSAADMARLSSRPAPRPGLDDTRFKILARCWSIAFWATEGATEDSFHSDGGLPRRLYYMEPLGEWHARWSDFIQPYATIRAANYQSLRFNSETARNLGNGIVVMHNNPWELIVDFALGAKTPQEIQREKRPTRTRL